MFQRSFTLTRALQLSCFIATAVFVIAAGAAFREDEEVLFFPAYAYHGKSGTVEVDVRGWVYEPEMKSRSRALVLSALKRIVGDDRTDEEMSIFESRMRHFLVDNERAKKIRVKIGEKIYDAGMSRPNGHFDGRITIAIAELAPLLDSRGNFTISLAGMPDGSRGVTGPLRLLQKEGLAVISDIDDTVKHTRVLDKKEMVRNTFLRPFRPVPGMAELFRRWERQGAVFHYVSGSPWHLFRPLEVFLEKGGFPRGCLYLKEFRLKDASGLRFIIGDNFTYKVSVLEGIILRNPGRDFILVGDSGERDPEVYARIWKKHGDRIRAVYIREVKNEKQVKRYESLFGNSPVLRVFFNGNEVR